MNKPLLHQRIIAITISDCFCLMDKVQVKLLLTMMSKSKNYKDLIFVTFDWKHTVVEKHKIDPKFLEKHDFIRTLTILLYFFFWGEKWVVKPTSQDTYPKPQVENTKSSKTKTISKPPVAMLNVTLRGNQEV